MTKHVDPRKQRGIVAVRADAGGGDIKAMIDALNKDWSEFKAAMAEKDKELAKRFDGVVTTEKIERINGSVSELQAAVDQANAKIAAMSIASGGPAGPAGDPEYSDAFRAHFR